MTDLVVQKYGGSVLVDEKAYTRAARHVARTVESGSRAVVVVSALKGTTDRLLGGARRIHHEPPPETLDLLLATGELQSAAWMALSLKQLGVPALALNPWQVGLHTDGRHGDARITHINPLPLRSALADHPVVIVPGFLGRREDNRITTLGRGGSDLSAVALSDALDARTCEFFKDVPGYFSADPRHVAEAMHRPQVTGEEAFELSRFGCRFLQDRAIDWAIRGSCRVKLRSLGEDDRATRLCRSVPEGHPTVLAMTHCPGPSSVLLSLVGMGLGMNEQLRTELEIHLQQQRITYQWHEGSDHRLTLAVPSNALLRAGRSIHERFIVENIIA